MNIMEMMGFGSRWWRWILECITSANVLVLVNGAPSAELKMERGLRQGDFVSPFLFIMVAEGLNELLNRALGLNIIKGVRIGHNGPHLVNLQFADDLIIFKNPHETPLIC